MTNGLAYLYVALLTDKNVLSNFNQKDFFLEKMKVIYESNWILNFRKSFHLENKKAVTRPARIAWLLEH